jgi:hypothetical protein
VKIRGIGTRAFIGTAATALPGTFIEPAQAAEQSDHSGSGIARKLQQGLHFEQVLDLAPPTASAQARAMTAQSVDKDAHRPLRPADQGSRLLG